MWTNKTRYVDICVTKHAIKRMRERGCNPAEIVAFLSKSKSLNLLRNHEGYEAILPLKGRLVGDFDKGAFVIKSFLFPFSISKSGRSDCVVRVLSVVLPS